MKVIVRYPDKSGKFTLDSRVDEVAIKLPPYEARKLAESLSMKCPKHGYDPEHDRWWGRNEDGSNSRKWELVNDDPSS